MSSTTFTGPRPRLPRRPAAFAALVLGPISLVVTAPAASAASSSVLTSAPPTARPAAEAAVTTFGIRPATATGADTTRTFLSYTKAGGGTLTDRVFVTNYSKAPLTLAVYAADAYNNPDGGYAVLVRDRPSQDVGAWVALAARTVTVAAGRGVVVPFSLRVPANAAAGDHAGGIVVALRRPQLVKGTRVLVEERVGVRVYLRVPGDLRPALQVENFSSRYGGTLNPLGGDVDVEYDVVNAGNVRLSATQSATLDVPLLGTRSGQMSPLRDLLPGGRAHVRVTLADVPPLGPLSTRVSVDPIASAGAPDPGLASVVRSATSWGLFWLVLLLVAAVGAAARFLGPVVARRLRARRAGRGDGPPPAGAVAPQPVTVA